MLSILSFARVLVGEPASTPDRVGGRLSPEHALETSHKPDDSLHYPPPAADDPDTVRDPAGDVRGGAVRTRRAGRARARAAVRHGYRRDLAHLGLVGRRLRRAP